MYRRIPLSWKNLTHNPRRLMLAVAGITFAVVLMFVERGFQNALFDSTIYVVRDLKTDLVLRSRGKYLFEAPHRFDIRHLVQAASHPEVLSATPLYVEVAGSHLRRVGHPSYPIRVLAFDVSKDLCRFPGVAEQKAKLADSQTAIIDEKSKLSAYRLPLHEPRKLPNIPVELAGKSVRIVGTFSLGTDFANDGTLILSPQNFARYFPYRGKGGDPLRFVDLGLIELRPNANPALVIQELSAHLPQDILVETQKFYVQREKLYWSESTPVGFIFLLGVILGFVVGTVICYQIIFTNINDYQAEFATLKAMGYRPIYFVIFVLEISVYLSIFGFIPGFVLTLGIFEILSHTTGLLMELTLWRTVTIYLLTLGMCVLSGGFAIRKVLSLEPAELF